MLRCVEPELLDQLPATSPQAVESRQDLRRVNGWMGHTGIVRRALREAGIRSTPRRIVELGAGDGTFLLRLAAQLPAGGQKTEALLVDQQDIVSAETRRAFAALGWDAQTAQADVSDWLRQWDARAGWMLANLFLHHFTTERLRVLLRQAGERTDLFVACEPRRAALPLAATRLLRLIGCNAVTRHDARVSVRAGFSGRELSALWPQDGDWQLSEGPAGLFSHCFVARRR